MVLAGNAKPFVLADRNLPSITLVLLTIIDTASNQYVKRQVFVARVKEFWGISGRKTGRIYYCTLVNFIVCNFLITLKSSIRCFHNEYFP